MYTTSIPLRQPGRRGGGSGRALRIGLRGRGGALQGSPIGERPRFPWGFHEMNGTFPWKLIKSPWKDGCSQFLFRNFLIADFLGMVIFKPFFIDPLNTTNSIHDCGVPITHKFHLLTMAHSKQHKMGIHHLRL